MLALRISLAESDINHIGELITRGYITYGDISDQIGFYLDNFNPTNSLVEYLLSLNSSLIITTLTKILVKNKNANIFVQVFPNVLNLTNMQILVQIIRICSYYNSSVEERLYCKKLIVLLVDQLENELIIDVINFVLMYYHTFDIQYIANDIILYIAFKAINNNNVFKHASIEIVILITEFAVANSISFEMLDRLSEYISYNDINNIKININILGKRVDYISLFEEDV